MPFSPSIVIHSTGRLSILCRPGTPHPQFSSHVLFTLTNLDWKQQVLPDEQFRISGPTIEVPLDSSYDCSNDSNWTSTINLLCAATAIDITPPPPSNNEPNFSIDNTTENVPSASQDNIGPVSAAGQQRQVLPRALLRPRQPGRHLPLSFERKSRTGCIRIA